MDASVKHNAFSSGPAMTLSLENAAHSLLFNVNEDLDHVLLFPLYHKWY